MGITTHMLLVQQSLLLAGPNDPAPARGSDRRLPQSPATSATGLPDLPPSPRGAVPNAGVPVRAANPRPPFGGQFGSPQRGQEGAGTLRGNDIPNVGVGTFPSNRGHFRAPATQPPDAIAGPAPPPAPAVGTPSVPIRTDNLVLPSQATPFPSAQSVPGPLFTVPPNVPVPGPVVTVPMGSQVPIPPGSRVPGRTFGSPILGRSSIPGADPQFDAAAARALLQQQSRAAYLRANPVPAAAAGAVPEIPGRVIRATGIAVRVLAVADIINRVEDFRSGSSMVFAAPPVSPATRELQENYAQDGITAAAGGLLEAGAGVNVPPMWFRDP